MRLLNEAANRIGAGEVKLAAIVGAEALRTAAGRAAKAAKGEDKSHNAVRQVATRREPNYAQKHGLSAPVDVAASLQLLAGASVFHLLGVHHENGVAVQLEDRWVNPRVAPDFLEQDFSTEQPSDWLVRNVAFDEIEHVVDAMLPTAWQAEHLQITPTEPCLMLTRRTWCRGQVVTMVRCLHPGARYRLGSRFRPQHGHGY